MAELVRRVVFFSGRVQGVGFRMATAGLARDYAVTGYVRNLDDGRVELVAEGAAAEVEGLLTRVRQHFRLHLTAVDEQPAAADGSFSGFAIRP